MSEPTQVSDGAYRGDCCPQCGALENRFVAEKRVAA
jgi:hypothetical protein